MEHYSLERTIKSQLHRDAASAVVQMVADHMKEELVELREEGKSNTLFDEAIEYVATMCTSLMDNHCFDSKQWEVCFTPYIGAFVGQRTKEACLCAVPLVSPLSHPPLCQTMHDCLRAITSSCARSLYTYLTL
jgi:hypothetical protein